MSDLIIFLIESSVQVSSSVSECHEDGGKSAPNKVVVADEIQLQSMQLCKPHINNILCVSVYMRGCVYRTTYIANRTLFLNVNSDRKGRQ